MTELHDLPLAELDTLAELAYADDWDVTIVDESTSDPLPPHGINSDEDKA